MPDSNYQKWKSLQSHWDDDEYLKSLTPLMKLRYRRLDGKVEAILDENFHETGAIKGRPLLLDIGAGRGEFAFFLQGRGRARVWNYLGFEPSGEQLKQRDIPEFGLGFVQAMAEQVPLGDMTAHGAVVKEAIDHCYDPAKVFAEAKRLLKPGGMLVVTVTNDKSYFKRLLPFVNNARKSKQTDHLFFFGPGELRKLAQEAKFDRVTVETYNYLKLPRILEQVLSLFGPSINQGLLSVTDAIGKVLLPGLGGGIILTAEKKF
jgi:ubiquinone/menaquinone biosynthesis C-methylase UbiE